MAARGENQWPPVGRTNGRPWGEPMTAVMPVDRGVKSEPAGPASLGGDMRLSNLRCCDAGESRMVVGPSPIPVRPLEAAPWVHG